MKTIFLHGLGQSPSSWNETIRVMDSKNEIISLDLFEMLCGQEVNYENLYKAFSEYCGNINEPINVCGLSLGAVIALHYGIENPSRNNSMALIAPQYNMPSALLKIQNIIFHFMPQTAFVKIGFSKKEFISLSESMSNLNFENDLYKVICPCLIICGQRDKANRKAAIQLHKIIPGSELKIIKGAGHEVNINSPMELGTALSNFFEKNS